MRLLAAPLVGLALGWLSAETSKRHGRWRQRRASPEQVMSDFLRQCDEGEVA